MPPPRDPGARRASLGAGDSHAQERRSAMSTKVRDLPDGAATCGDNPNAQARPRPRPEPDLLADLREAGRPIKDIAERLGLSRATTYRWLVRYGIPRRPLALHRGAEPSDGDRGR